MVVSHFAVSLIQVFGLIVGAMGAFYLSLGLFGKSGTNLARPLLPAVSFALVPTSLVAATNHWQEPPIRIPPGVYVLLAVIGFAIGYGVGFIYQRPLIQRLYRPSLLRTSLIFTLGAALCFIDLVVIHHDSPGWALVLVAGTLVSTWTLFAASRLALRLDDKQLQMTGFVASMLGVSVQFIPPILDLFNIPIR